MDEATSGNERRRKREPVAIRVRFPRRRDLRLREDLREEARKHELSEAGLVRWILRAVLNGEHPARVRARLIATRKKNAEARPPPGEHS